MKIKDQRAMYPKEFIKNNGKWIEVKKGKTQVVAVENKIGEKVKDISQSIEEIGGRQGNLDPW